MTPVSVGVVGAGPWATRVSAPVFAAGPETTLSGVWARRADARDALAATHSATSFPTFEALVAASDVVAFCVPPAVQAELALVAVAAGKAVMLEKPLADDLAGARRLVDAIDDAGVVSQVGLTYRYMAAAREFLAAAATFPAIGGRGCFISGAYLGRDLASSAWRHERGALLDVGPHLFDLLTAALGPATVVGARRSPGDFVSVVFEHESGAVSDATVCCRANTDSRTDVELFSEDAGVLTFEGRSGSRDDLFATLRRELAECVRTGRSHELDAHHALGLQQLIAEVEAKL